MKNKRGLTKEFFEGKSAPELARSLLGKLLVVDNGKEIVSGVINETEAYSENDPASHSYGGKKTMRNKTMFERGGHIYVYTSYGIHSCMNIVSGKEGIGSGVLIRSIIPKDGIEIMKHRRGRVSDKALTNGPGKLSQALAITKDFDGIYTLRSDAPIKIYEIGYEVPKILSTPRIGISKAVDMHWRFTF